MPETITEKLSTRFTALKNERSSWDAHCKEISQSLLPRSGRWFLDDRNKGDKRHNAILDSTGTRALRILAAGMQAGMTSPARPWFRLTTSDPKLDESAAVKKWLADTTRLMQMVFAKSNTYRALHIGYEELGAFGTWASIITKDFKSVIRHHPLTFGEYCLATDANGDVNTLAREYRMTVAQMVAEFGRDAVTQSVRQQFDTGNLERPCTVMHMIEPRADRDARKRDARNMPWRSVYFQPDAEPGKVLRESGFKSFRAVAPRWAVTSGDIYGNSPAMEALGDIKQLQHEQTRKAQGIDYKTKPPVQAPTSLRNDGASQLLPGGVSYYDQMQAGGGIRTAFEVNIDLSHLLEDIQDVRERIRASFYADLFLMLGNSDVRMTATEVAERHEEKMLMLGPVIERLHNEILDPKIEITFDTMLEAGIVPPPPPEMQGRELSVEFVSILAQAQKAVSTNSIDRFVMSLGTVATVKPEVLDKFDADHWADIYSDALGIDPELIVPSDRVAMIREQRAQQQASAEQAAMAQQAAETASKLGGIDTSKPSALNDVMSAFSGYT